MSGVDTRNIQRDSLFLLAEVRLEGESAGHRVKVRNLSAGVMMAEGGPPVLRGARVSVELRNLDPIEGTVVWVQDTRFGIAFAKEIDPMLPRNPVGNGDISSPRYTRPSSIQTAYGGETAPGIRKI
jgi:hypothetical protein